MLSNSAVLVVVTSVEFVVVSRLPRLRAAAFVSLSWPGGVGANRELRRQLDEAGRARGFRVFYPEMALCTDNGAMIAFAGALRLAGGSHAGDGAFAVKPRWPLSSITVTD